MIEELKEELIAILPIAMQKNKYLVNFAKIMYEAYSSNGLPPEISFDRLEENYTFTNENKAKVAFEYLDLVLMGKIKTGGITEANIAKQQGYNRKKVLKILNTGNFEL